MAAMLARPRRKLASCLATTSEKSVGAVANNLGLDTPSVGRPDMSTSRAYLPSMGHTDLVFRQCHSHIALRSASGNLSAI